MKYYAQYSNTHPNILVAGDDSLCILPVTEVAAFVSAVKDLSYREVPTNKVDPIGLG